MRAAALAAFAAVAVLASTQPTFATVGSRWAPIPSPPAPAPQAPALAPRAGTTAAYGQFSAARTGLGGQDTATRAGLGQTTVTARAPGPLAGGLPASVGSSLYILTARKARLVVPSAQDPTRGVLTLHDVAPVAISIGGKHAANASAHVLTQMFLLSPAYNGNTTWMNAPNAALHGVLAHRHHAQDKGMAPAAAVASGSSMGAAASWGRTRATPAPTMAVASQPSGAGSPAGGPGQHEHKPSKVSVVVVLTLLEKVYDVASGDVMFKCNILSSCRGVKVRPGCHRDRFSDNGGKDESHFPHQGGVSSTSSGQTHGNPLRGQLDMAMAPSPSAMQHWANGNVTYDNIALFIDGLRSHAGPYSL